MRRETTAGRRLLPLLAICILLAPDPLGADEKRRPMTPEEVVDAFLAAREIKAPYGSLVTSTRPDPWLVADVFLARQLHEPAQVYVAAVVKRALEVDAKDVAKLDDYVFAPAPGAAAVRDVLAKGNAHLREGKPAEALRILDTQAKAQPSVPAARLHFARGHALKRLEKYRASEHAFHAAAKTARALGWLKLAARSHMERSRSAFKLTDRPAAIAALMDELAIHTTRGSENDMGGVWSNLGYYMYKRAGQHRKAIEAFEKAGAHFAKAKNAREVDWVRSQLVGEFLAVADMRSARKVAHIRLADARAQKDQHREAAVLLSLARILQREGAFAKALPLAESSLAIRRRLGDRKGESSSLATLGGLYSSLGDLDKSLTAKREALAIKRELGDRFAIGIALGNLGNLHVLRGEFEKGRTHLREALTIAKELGDTVGIAANARGLGEVEYALEHYANALDWLEVALEHARKADDPFELAGVHLHLARVYTKLKKHEKAQLASAVVTALGRKHGMVEKEVKGLWGEGGAFYRQGRFTDALERLKEARRRLPLLLQGLGDRHRLHMQEAWNGIHIYGVLSSIALGDPEGIFFFHERYRAGALLAALGGRELARESEIPEFLRKADAAAREAVVARRRAYAIALQSGSRKDQKEADRALEAAQDEVYEVSERIQRTLRQGDLQRIVPCTLAELQSALPADAAFVIYMDFVDGVYASVIDKTSARVVQLENREPIQAAATALDAEDREADPAPALARLKAALVDPLKLPATARRVLLVTDASLASVPFAALLPNRVVSYAPSGTTWTWLRGLEQPQGDGVLALGDPAYQGTPAEARAAHRGTVLERLPRLPGTRDEALGVGTVTLLGKDASESGLATELRRRPRWRALHLACHGLADDDHPARSALALSADAKTDGFLDCAEISRLDVPADLVVLSACETAQGKAYQSAGMVGLARAFMTAGAPRVIASLWKVDDAATLALMRKFYELWNPGNGKPGLPTAEALRAAQAHVRAQPKWKHPYYWAAWVLWGRHD